MMCHLDETSYSRYNAAAHFGTRGLLQQRPKTHFGVDAVSVAAAGNEKKCHVECLGGWR